MYIYICVDIYIYTSYYSTFLPTKLPMSGEQVLDKTSKSMNKASPGGIVFHRVAMGDESGVGRLGWECREGYLVKDPGAMGSDGEKH
jgi:hypothetical protein